MGKVVIDVYQISRAQCAAYLAMVSGMEIEYVGERYSYGEFTFFYKNGAWWLQCTEEGMWCLSSAYLEKRGRKK